MNSSYEKLKAIIHSINEIGYVTYHLSQMMITGMIPQPIHHRQSRHWQCWSWHCSRDVLNPDPTNASDAGKILNVHLPVKKVDLLNTAVGLRNTWDSCGSTLMMAVAFKITFHTTRWSHLHYRWYEEFYQWLCNVATIITDRFCLLMDSVQDME